MAKLFVKVFFREDNRLRKYYEMKKRAKNIKKTKGKIPPYLADNNVETELNYKLWVTKGARFKASERCEGLDRRSTKIVGWLSAYLIIFSVLNICDIEMFKLPTNVSNFISISISIMILVFSQFEYAMSYSTKAKAYHDCALKISKLYDDLRMQKSDQPIENHSLIAKIADEYQLILAGNTNHLPIDYKMFKSYKPAYFNMSKWQISGVRFSYYIKTKFAFHALVYGMPLTYILYIVLR